MCVCVWGGVLKYEIGIYLFKNGGLKERSLTENAGRGGVVVSERPLTGKQGIWELKITKKRIFF